MKSKDKLADALRSCGPTLFILPDSLQTLSSRLDKVEPLSREVEAKRRSFRQGALIGMSLGILATLSLIRVLLPGFMF